MVGRSFNICEWEEYHVEQCQLPQCEERIVFSEEMESRVKEPPREFVDTFLPFTPTNNPNKITLSSYSGEVVLVAKWEFGEGGVVVRGSITLDHEDGEFMAFLLMLMEHIEEVVLEEKKEQKEQQWVEEQHLARGEVTPPPTQDWRDMEGARAEGQRTGSLPDCSCSNSDNVRSMVCLLVSCRKRKSWSRR